MRVLPLLLTIFLLATSLRAASPPPAPELRGTWLTTTANPAISTPEHTAATMRRLRDIGLNTVYVECWKNGYAEFPSETLRKATGVASRINPSAKDHPALQRDLLGECVREAHANGLACVAWFEYGFMAAYKETHNELRARRDWLSLDAHGHDVARNNFVWLNPLHPDAQQLLIDLVVEAVHKYDLDGVQLDDRLAWPGLEMGYDDFTKRAYAHDHDGQGPPADPDDAEWRRWREQKVTDFARRFVRAVRAANPRVTISLSPGPHPWALEHYLCNWPTWTEWDQFVPQCYRLDYASFAKSWRDQLAAVGDRKSALIAGIRVVGDGPDLPWDDLKRSIELTRTTGAGGHCLWFSRGVLDLYPDQLKAFYNGFVPSPIRQNGQSGR